ncbi:hypothetical protein GDO81_012456 [Engystomops pustulosus]|uniref:Secreted protein n=1 Tax=Engystomops pustulosus TaxID=76066 RepID=A0AAV7BM56_ENGPU|nr:hypothetical protein GDO81_012456 [Engystomops pustulosus]
MTRVSMFSNNSVTIILCLVLQDFGLEVRISGHCLRNEISKYKSSLKVEPNTSEYKMQFPTPATTHRMQLHFWFHALCGAKS